MNTNDIAIQIVGLKKMYKLGQIGGGTLQGDIQSWWARIRGKEDPNSKIGADQRSNGKTFMALNGIDLTVRKGEALGIIGHNGAGKSTLLKLLSRVTAPTEGEIRMNGRIASMLEVGTGFNGEMTGRENIYMNGAILGMSRAEVDAKMEQIIDFSEVREFIDTPVKRYSSGMYVKLAFSVAAHLDSEIMIMDEVLAVGDMAFQKKCLDKMREAATKEGRTVLYVSHNMNTIRQLCDRCVVLDNGRISFEGSVEDAIAVYMKSNVHNNLSLDLSTVERLAFLKKDDARFLSASYLGKDDIIFKRNEPYEFNMKWKANKDVNKLSFRMVVYGADGSHLCASFCHNMFSAQKGDIVSMKLSYDISAIAPGRYMSYYVFFTENEMGMTEDIDQLRGLDFMVDDVTDMGKLPWRPNAWGHFELSPPTVTVTSEESV